jgi:hypothetical protein
MCELDSYESPLPKARKPVESQDLQKNGESPRRWTWIWDLGFGFQISDFVTELRIAIKRDRDRFNAQNADDAF